MKTHLTISLKIKYTDIYRIGECIVKISILYTTLYECTNNMLGWVLVSLAQS